MRRLLCCSARVFARFDPTIATELKAALPRIDAGLTSYPATGLFPPLEPSGGGHGEGESPLGCMKDCARLLHWRRPGFGHLPAAISDAILVTEIVGPDGMVPHDTFRFGALYQTAGHDYPDHNHDADEVYHILQGSALWSTGGAPASRRGSGAFIHHAPSVMHSIRTSDEPMLALWVWRGEIGAQSYRLK